MNGQTKDLKILTEAKTFLDADQIKVKEALKNHTSFKIGGPADILFLPKTSDQVTRLLQLCHEYNMECFVLGKGSNLLMTDKGYRGAVIKLSDNFESVQIEGNKIRAQAGISLAKLSEKAAKASLTGLEFASGIPGTLGGAVYMNAGAYGGEMSQVVDYVQAVDEKGNICILSKEDLNFGYRQSIFQGAAWIILEVGLKLEEGQQALIVETMKTLNQKRRDKQPLEYPSAGSTFKRPEGYYAGKLIMDSGLRGHRIGDAMVSEKHCGFVVNAGKATFKDVQALIIYIQETVKEKYGVDLEREVKIIGER